MIRKLEALQRRLPISHPARKKVDEELAKCYAGFRGELSIDYQLSFLEGEYEIFHDIRIPFRESSFFQMDILFVTTRFLLIIEVKNIAGILFFEPNFHQLIRTMNEKEDIFPDPILQVKKHMFQLQAWLKHHQLPLLPIEALVVISNPSTLIRTNPHYENIYRIVTHAANLPTKVSTINSNFQNELWTKKDLCKMLRLVQKEHTEADYDILNRFQIASSVLLTGILCLDCHDAVLMRKRERWLCPRCGKSFKNAHIQALMDYRLLIGPTITNEQLRSFLGISSVNKASKLLVSLNLHSSGAKRNRVYHLSLDELMRYLS